MPPPADSAGETHQEQFHRKWWHLRDPHVRTLAWLLDAPDLLDASSPQWMGQVATLDPVDEETMHWLSELDQSPAVLHTFLNIQPFTRLGRYAERLMAFYLERRGCLVAHGLQVRTEKGETVGEFDFLLDAQGALVHWEFATKLYLLEASGRGEHADYFVGPNLADTFGTKVRKIMERQLSLSCHPAAQHWLPREVVRAQALVKGWLFYHGATPAPLQPEGISKAHCRGFWKTLAEFDVTVEERFLLLPRLSWLAPARSAGDDVVHGDELREVLQACLAHATTPVLVAQLDQVAGEFLEVDRGFIVPNDWGERAGQRVQGLG